MVHSSSVGLCIVQPSSVEDFVVSSSSVGVCMVHSSSVALCMVQPSSVEDSVVTWSSLGCFWYTHEVSCCVWYNNEVLRIL